LVLQDGERLEGEFRDGRGITGQGIGTNPTATATKESSETAGSTVAAS
jgi:hypothetical protein